MKHNIPQIIKNIENIFIDIKTDIESEKNISRK